MRVIAALLRQFGPTGGGGGGIASPTLTVVDNGLGTGATATIAGSTAGTTNTILYQREGAAAWTTGGSRSGDGAVALTMTPGTYWAYATSVLTPDANKSNPVRFGVSYVAPTDPLSVVFAALWTMLEAHSPLTTLVPPGNRIKFTGQAINPDKQEVLTADFPYLRIVCPGLATHIQQTSHSGMVTLQFVVQVGTGEQGFNATAGLFPVIWEIIRGLHGWQAVLAALTWNSKTFVHLCRPLDAVNALTITNAENVSQGIKGWSSVWAGEVQLHFTTADLAPVA